MRQTLQRSKKPFDLIECKIYKEIFVRLQKHIPTIEPKHCIFIDDKTNNTKSAEEFGFRTITWNGGKQEIEDLISGFQKHGVTIYSTEKKI
jgi:FMN phosphatase YigB (HAD superfamily)